ncbi:Uncharacterized protein YneR [Marininema mesophilum]|uniref:Uncharacterized protein YneR n=1 Tax=Marininema mesophilum TaxID=1048340 RepID=A0A1H2ZYH6_9BACL|nr:hypothetical protein [Marininema mesophilum]SDX22416.1 Uncharacterized protein YneR [Marininema mesophilum]
MGIEITPTALHWFQRELSLGEGDALRFDVRYDDSLSIGRNPNGFSLRLTVEKPRHPGLQTVEEGITFFIEEDELWFLDGNDLRVDYDEQEDELLYEVRDPE